MRIDLSGRRAVVSGSTSGIGWETAHGLAEAGATVIINGRDRVRVEEATKRLSDAVPGATAKGIAADLGTAEGVRDFLAQVPDCDPGQQSRHLRSQAFP